MRESVYTILWHIREYLILNLGSPNDVRSQYVEKPYQSLSSMFQIYRSNIQKQNKTQNTYFLKGALN